MALLALGLAEKLNITDRAVSKWETGRALPDSTIMIELCDILKISVNELLCGEVLSMETYNKNVEENLIEMIKEKERNDKMLLSLELVISNVNEVLISIIKLVLPTFV